MKASTLLWATFPPTTIRLLQQLSRFVAERGGQTFIVGGAVRDAMLGVPTADVDIMLEGEFFSLLQEIKESWETILPGTSPPQRLITFPKYQTAKLIFPSDVVPGISVIDFSGARKESYPHPGAQPLVVPATVEEDLKRRDFSINAMALALGPERFGEVLDLFHGQQHLVERTLSVLHPVSFRDDPARIVRGVRFISRFGFTWSRDTADLVQEALSLQYLTTVKAERRLDEFRKALSERQVLQTVSLLEELKLLPHLAPSAVLDARTKRVLAEVERMSKGGRVSFRGREVEAWKLALVSLFLGVSESLFGDALALMALSPKLVPEMLALRTEVEALYAP